MRSIRTCSRGTPRRGGRSTASAIYSGTISLSSSAQATPPVVSDDDLTVEERAGGSPSSAFREWCAVSQEHRLNGRVMFESCNGEGTCFDATGVVRPMAFLEQPIG